MANTASNNRVQIWRGLRTTYDTLVANNNTSYWTHYYVKEASGCWTEYFGNIRISLQTGQLYPVDTIVSTLPSNLIPGQRFLVGIDGDTNKKAEYYVVEIAPELVKSTITPLGDMSVRVKDRNLYNYQIVNNKLITYDGDISAGIF